MIIKATRISTASGPGAIARHVFEGADNEEIVTVAGTREDLEDMMRDARQIDAKYGIRHVVLSPAEETSREQAIAIAEAWMAEFGAGGHPYVLIEHRKRRAGGAGFDRHWHLLVSEINPASGRVLSSAHLFARNEKIARLMELRLGHAVTPGRHNRAVGVALEKDGHHAEAVAIRAATLGRPPPAAFTSDAHQCLKRRGLSLPEVRREVSEAWARSDSREALLHALSERGLHIEQGRRKWIVVGADASGERVEFGSLDRLAKVRGEAVKARMKGEGRDDRTEAAVAIGGPCEGGRQGGTRSARDGQTDRPNADRGRRPERPEYHRADCRTVGEQSVLLESIASDVDALKRGRPPVSGAVSRP